MYGNTNYNYEQANRNTLNMEIQISSNDSPEEQWNKTWGGIIEDKGLAIVLDSSDNIFITGFTNSFGAGWNDIVLIKYGKSSVDNGLAPIPGYDLFLLLGVICVISTIIVKRRHKSQ